MALALLLFAVVLIKAPASAQIKPSGKYKVTVFLPDSIDDVSVMQGDKIYLFKSRWSGKIKNIKIDSAIVSSKRSITFKGFTYDMRGDGMAERTSNKFTAGEYLIACGKQPGKSFITFFYSSLAGDNFN